MNNPLHRILESTDHLVIISVLNDMYAINRQLNGVFNENDYVWGLGLNIYSQVRSNQPSSSKLLGMTYICLDRNYHPNTIILRCKYENITVDVSRFYPSNYADIVASIMSKLPERYKTCGRCTHQTENPDIASSTCYLCKRNPTDHRIDCFDEAKEE